MLKKFCYSQNNYLYDLIFPIFMMWLFPPIMAIVLVGNYIVDGVIIFIVFRLFKIKIGKPQWAFLTQMWAIGLAVDLVGSIILFSSTTPGKYTIWNYSETAFIFLSVVTLCGLMLGLLNYWLAMKKFHNPRMALYFGLAMGILTAPWTFLIPTPIN